MTDFVFPTLDCGRFVFNKSRPIVMGIVNITPDSFSDGGKFAQKEAALRHADALQKAGADIIDIGGESSRPGAAPVSLQEELDRVLPIIEALRERDIALSVDTYKAEVMREAIKLGVDMINDIWALRQPDALQTAAQSNCAVCLMHMQKDPQTMQFEPHYNDIVNDVCAFLLARAKAAEQAGISANRIVLDPGFGFGKTLRHNTQLMQQLNQFTALPYSILAGLSRKSMLGEITGKKPDERIAASVAAHLLAVQKGTHIVRVHDVAETVDALKVWQALA